MAGIIYERIDGPSLIGAIERHPFRLLEHAALLARLHAAIHTHTYSQAPEGVAKTEEDPGWETPAPTWRAPP